MGVGTLQRQFGSEGRIGLTGAELYLGDGNSKGDRPTA